MIVLEIFVWAYVCLNLVLLVLALISKTPGVNATSQDVAILVPFRDEKENLKELLESLSRLTYSKSNLRIIFGNDESTDGSEKIIKEYIKENAGCTLIELKGYESKQRAKARVLEKMISEVSANFYFIIDADVRIHKNSIQSMLNYMTPKTGLVSGITIPSIKGFWSRYDSFDWFWNLVLLKSNNQFGNAATALGNNMLMSREAYDKIGGFENMSFSLTEDFALNKAFVGAGYKPKFAWGLESHAHTEPVSGFKEMINQRRRWLVGISQVTLFLRFLILLFVIEFPIIVVAIVLNFGLWPIVFLWLVLKFKVVLLRSGRIGEFKMLLYLPLYQVLVSLVSGALFFFSLKNKNITWKDRGYNS